MFGIFKKRPKKPGVENSYVRQWHADFQLRNDRLLIHMEMNKIVARLGSFEEDCIRLGVENYLYDFQNVYQQYNLKITQLDTPVQRRDDVALNEELLDVAGDLLSSLVVLMGTTEQKGLDLNDLSKSLTSLVIKDLKTRRTD
jgi:hypothetical protein